MRYLIAYLITIALLLSVIFLIFHSGGPKTAPKTVASLSSYAKTDAAVRLTVDGPINANQKHQSIAITVDQYEVTYQQFQGYDGQVVYQQEYANTENAYYAFLSALNIAGYTDGNSAPSLSNQQGHCALGSRYIIELTESGNDIDRFWSTSCPGVTGTFKGNLAQVTTLFDAQIPNYSQLVENVYL